MNTLHGNVSLAFLMAVLPLLSAHAQQVPKNSEPPRPPSSIDVLQQYYPSGFMGDGESGTKYLQLQDACTDKPHSPPHCVKVSYTTGPTGWAGIYWQNKPNNWGDKPGEDFSQNGFKFVTFWARGETGTEIIEFKAGGIDASGKPHKDSFEKTIGRQTLTTAWKPYRIPLSGANLSNVIGMFCFAASGTANPKGVTFYLDDVQYE